MKPKSLKRLNKRELRRLQKRILSPQQERANQELNLRKLAKSIDREVARNRRKKARRGDV